MITNGPYFTATLRALGLDATQRAEAERNATNIIRAVATTYGAGQDGTIDAARTPNAPVTGLVYGRIQSGKTRAMIASTALAFDNKFRISVVMTSNINDLVSQTHLDFTSALPGLMTFTKDNDLEREVANTRLHLDRGDGRLLLICSKGTTSLRNISRFLTSIASLRYPAIIFDDEGDQASLDTNIRKRSRSRGAQVVPSTINDIIQNTLRPGVPKHVYVSVTGTPQAVLLQSADSNNRPSFIVMLPPGATYVGGDRFFGSEDPHNVLADLSAAHATLATTLGAQTPEFDRVAQTIRQYLPGRRLLVINARTKRQGIDYGPGLNFLIGGNTLGRGIAIRDLLVTYYVREARMSQIDTMHQHARMYGYRVETLPYTRLFIPRHLYYRFRDIHNSDEDLRDFIEQHRDELPTTFPVEVAFNLRATRQGVLEAGKIDTLQPGQHLYPNYIVVPQDRQAYDRVMRLLRGHFNVPQGTPDQIERAAGAGVMINLAAAKALISPIQTKSKNTWRDSTIADVVAKVADQFGDRIRLRFRTADRTVREGGYLSTGTLAGDQLIAARAADVPTLWIMAATTKNDSAAGAGRTFMYPTFVIPSRFPSLFIFNRGS